tara:strand:- start:56 stop:499 length:444 start_codon:yes stop_codon:yes gene_type:complete
MSTLKVDTIVASNGTSPVAMTKQEALKHWVNYDAVNQTTDGSLNQSSITDNDTGEFDSNFTNNFSSASNKCHFASVINSADDGETRVSSQIRNGVSSNIGHIVNDSTAAPLSTSEVQFYSSYGSSAAANGANYDFSATFCSSIGDLA